MGSGSEISEDGSDDSDIAWQIAMPKKRHQLRSPKMHRHKRIALDEGPSTSNNTFSVLDETNNDNEHNNFTENNDNEDNENSEPKPPPIMIPNVSDIKTMVNNFSKVIDPNGFSYKSLRDGNVRVMAKTTNAYRTLVKYLDDTSINFHTYQLKQERAYRVVVKNLHFSTPTNLIKDEIEKKGHKVRNILNIRSKFTKKPLSMFYIDLEPNKNNMEIFNLRYLYNAVIRIEAPLKLDDVVQCFRCQQYGHTKAYCRNHFKCVKCGLNHSTVHCTKPASTPPQCSNCLETHTASYKGCNVYKQLLQRKKLIKRQSTHNNVQAEPEINNTNFPNFKTRTPHHNTNYANNQFSYADVIKNNNTQQRETSTLDRIETILSSLVNMMNILITKLCN